MTAYFIKVTLCSVLFFAVYKWVFENEKMLRFNRFYLLFSIVFSFVVPFITIQNDAVILPAAEMNVLNTNFLTYNNTQNTVPVNDSNTLAFAAWSAYVTITLFLLLRFCINLKRLFSKISTNPVISFNNAKLVLINEHSIPYSFLNFIFINKEDYSNGKTEKEILLHEVTHVQQKHSMDVLFIELVQAICWFNPVFIFYRKAIQLNHEFLADERVINIYQNTLTYQNLLLDKTSPKSSLFLTNPFNYLITKKRLIMMTKTTSAAKALCKQMILVPLSVVAILMFSSKIMAQDTMKTGQSEPKKIQPAKEGVSQKMLDEYSRIINKNKLNVQAKYTNPPVVSGADRNRLETIFFSMSKEQQAKQTVTFVHIASLLKNKLTKEQFTSFKNPKKYAITINDEKVDNSQLDNYTPSDFSNFSVVYLARTNSNYGKHLPLDVYLMTMEYYKADIERKKDNIMVSYSFKKLVQK